MHSLISTASTQPLIDRWSIYKHYSVLSIVFIAWWRVPTACMCSAIKRVFCSSILSWSRLPSNPTRHHCASAPCQRGDNLRKIIMDKVSIHIYWRRKGIPWFLFSLAIMPRDAPGRLVRPYNSRFFMDLLLRQLQQGDIGLLCSWIKTPRAVRSAGTAAAVLEKMMN